MAQPAASPVSIPMSHGAEMVNAVVASSPQIIEPPCFAIAGCGRSGTSMVAAMLQRAGLDIGARLMGPGDANKHGHFEDLDFHDFHVNVLRAQGFHETGFVSQAHVAVPQQFAQSARDLVERRRASGRPWGWKEPRTTLFLDFWHSLLPRLNYLFLFRAPWEVVDSLFRRGDVNFLSNPSMAVRVWLTYNRAVLDFRSRYPERCLLVESYAAGREPAQLIAAIARKFGHHFGPVEGIYDEELYTRHVTQQHQAVLAHYFPEAIDMYEELRRAAELTAPRDLFTVEASAAATEDWALQDWVDSRSAQAQLKWWQAQLEQTRQQAAGALQEHSAELNDLRGQVKQLGDELEQARRQAREFQSQIALMESSKFWLLRRWWRRLRHPRGDVDC